MEYVAQGPVPSPDTLLTAPVLVERAHLLSFMERVFSEVVGRPQARVVLIAGEAGVGKTTLVRRFCDERGGAARLLWGACDALFTPRPLGPIFDIAEALHGELDALLEKDTKPHEVARALTNLLRAGPPSIVVVEDLHRADEATLDVLRLLGRKLGGIPVLLIGTYRDDELGRTHPLRMVLGDLRNSADRLTVEPLSPAAVATLAEPRGVDADDLYRKSAGNPFFVTEALASGSNIPSTVHDAVLARAARLSPQARKVLEAVAIVPPPMEDLLLHALQPDALDHLDECLDSGNLVADGRNIAFRHELARLVIIESISPIQRVILHKAALRGLKEITDNDADLARLAHHADLGGDADAVLRFAPAAARRAAELGAHREAAAQYARALRFAEGWPLETRAELLERYSYECYLTDLSDEAIEARERAIDCYRRLRSKVREGDSLRWLSRLVSCRGRVEKSREFGQAAVRILESCPPSPELAMAYSNLAADFAESEDREGAWAWGRRAIDLAKRFDDNETYAHALNSMGLASFLVGEESGRRELEESLEVCLREGFEEHAARAFINLAAATSRTRSPQLMQRYLDQGMDYCEERGLDLGRMYLLAYGARSDIDHGRWSAAVAAAGRVLEAGLPSTLPRLLALVTIALVRARRGDDGHEDLLEEAAGLVVPGELQSVGVVAAARAEISWLTGNQDAVAVITQEAYDIARRVRSPWPVGELAYWRWRGGVREEIPAEAARPYALQIGGDWQAAARLWDELECPYVAALARVDSDEEVALRRSLQDLQDLGARPAAAMVARRLRELGVRGVRRGPQPATRRNPANLTGRELEVLELLAEGLRDRQIAERLVVSEKTVNHHVSAILGKLGVATRGQASAEWIRLGSKDR